MDHEGPEPQTGPADPAAMLGEVRRLRRQAREARHGYWFPLLLFGVLTCASAPFYIQPVPRTGTYVVSGPFLPAFGGIGTPGWQRYLAYYWLSAIAVGLGLTWLWYRRRGRRAGVTTPSRGYLIASAALVILALLPWLLSRLTGRGLFLFVLPGDLVVRGTFPFVIIGLGFWVLARAERSWALLAIAAVYTGTALLASLYNVENLLFRLGWNPTGFGIRLTALPNVLLPALVLLATGTGAFVAQRRPRRAGNSA